MAAIIGQMLILEQLMPMRRQHCRVFSDNTPAVSWTTNLVAKADSVVAARLLRALAMRSRTTESALPLTAHWPGDQNDHAGTASRSTSKLHSGPNQGEPCVKDCTFLTLFRSTFYSPQEAIMATATSARAPTLAADLDTAWAEIAHATVDVQTRQRNCKLWTTYCADNGYSDPLLRGQQAAERLQVLLGFAARCRSGIWGHGRQI
jgi:hypothetical protein